MKLVHTKLLPQTKTSHDSEVLKKVFLDKNNIPNLCMFGAATFAPNQKIEAHQHPTMYEVFYVLKGKLDFIVAQKKTTVVAGDCITIAPTEMHSQHNPYPTPAELIYFGIATDVF